MQVRSVDRDVRELLAANFYKIPRFQRPYSWDRENVDEFWNDTAGDNRPQDYFIGSMVVFPDGRGDINIVDGQQRLTTITIALCALRDIFHNEGLEQLALGAQSLIEKVNVNNEGRFVLSTESSYPFFQNRILSYGNRPAVPVEVGPEEQNIQIAYDSLIVYINSSIANLRDHGTLSVEQKREQISARLTAIRDKVLSLKLILVELREEDDAYVIFETLNTRGKDLSVSDLLRNFFTRHIRPANQEVDTARIQWQNILVIINESSAELNVDTYLHHQWLSRRGHITVRELFRSIKREIRGVDIQSYLDELGRDVGIYRQIHETTYVSWTVQERGIENSLNAIQLFRVRQQTPFVLALLREYRAATLRIPHVASMLQALENFHFLFNAVSQQRSSGGISKMFVSSAIQLDRAPNVQRKQAVIRDLMTKLRERVPPLDVFKATFRQILFTNTITKNKALTRYILSKIDALARPGVVVDYSAMTVEHLYAQHPPANPMPEEIIGMLGNLILVDAPLNDRLANRPVIEKIAILREAGYPLDDILANAGDFNQDVIERRTDYLAEDAYQRIWHV